LFGLWGIFFSSEPVAERIERLLGEAAAQGRPYDLLVLDYDTASQIDTLTWLGTERARLGVRTLILGGAAEQSNDVDGLLRVAKPVRESRLYDAIIHTLSQPKTAPKPARAPSLARNLRVLVVEDQRANQEVARGMLQRLGCAVDIVDSGETAVERLASRSYDIVLMDIQMPHMDGYQTTAHIREHEAGGDRRTPIVAMTAHVGPAERQRCLDADMDDYMSKPLSLTRLEAVLQRWCAEFRRRDTGSPARRSTPAPVEVWAEHATDAQAPSLDGSVLADLKQSLGLDGLARLADVFFDDTPVLLEEAQDLLHARTKDAFIDVVHAVKGTALNMGGVRLGELCTRARALAIQEEWDAAHVVLGDIVREYETISALLHHEIQDAWGGARPDVESRASILLADGERALRLALQSVLGSSGYRVTETASGDDVLAVCREDIPDLVLLGTRLSERDELATCEAVRELPGCESIPILMVTDRSDEEDVERLFAAGATDLVTKPLNFALLQKRVERLLSARRVEKQAETLSSRDAITGLPNRAMFLQRLGLLLRGARREAPLSLLLLDLDRFKLVNETLGHDVGDMLIRAVSERIGECLRTDDMLARMGADEFAMLLPGAADEQKVAKVAQSILEGIAKPQTIMGQEVCITGSIGIALHPQDGVNATTLVKHADTAMFRAKETGNSYQFYAASMSVGGAKRLSLERELRRAIEQQEFVLHYQPQVDLAAKRYVGLEALVRWNHPERGMIPPNDFIPVAEETGLIIPIGEWVLGETLRQQKAWLERGHQPMRVAVNLSARQLERDRLLKEVSAALDETGMNPDMLELEITESTMVRRADDVLGLLTKLKDIGVRIAIDDFGTGYTVLSYLKRFPVDTLKVDRSFVRDITSDAADASLIQAIIAIARSLDLEVVAEGVESVEQAIALGEFGCPIMQGWFFGRPVPSTEFESSYLEQQVPPGIGNIAFLKPNR
jgi:diguanylate cyclase (GGDEF)-like protein